MAAFTFKKATKEKLKARVAFLGPAGAGKTYSALAVGSRLGQRMAVIDTEHGSARKYASDFSFDVLELDSFSPDTYVAAIHAAEQAGYDVIVIDSLSHAWMGKDGALEMVDRVKKRGGNGFNAWGDVTPKQTAMVEAMVACKAHLLVTMRSKMEYVQEKDERTGKTTIRKVGMAPVQRDGLEYEFDVVGDMTQDNLFIVTKSRCSALAGKEFDKPGANVATPLLAWLDDGAEKAPSPASRPAQTEPAPAPQHEPNLVLDAALAAIADAPTVDALDGMADKLGKMRDALGRGCPDDKRIVDAYRARKAALVAKPAAESAA
jgi:hypothetical protein